MTPSPKKIAVPKMPSTSSAPAQPGRSATAVRGQRQHRDQAAFAVVVGAQDQQHVLQRDDDRQRPEDQRQHAEDVVAASAARGRARRLPSAHTAGWCRCRRRRRRRRRASGPRGWRRRAGVTCRRIGRRARRSGCDVRMSRRGARHAAPAAMRAGRNVASQQRRRRRRLLVDLGVRVGGFELVARRQHRQAADHAVHVEAVRRAGARLGARAWAGGCSRRRPAARSSRRARSGSRRCRARHARGRSRRPRSGRSCRPPARPPRR